MLVVVPPLQENKMTFFAVDKFVPSSSNIPRHVSARGHTHTNDFFTGMEIRIRSGSKFIFVLNHKLLGTKRSIFRCGSILHYRMSKAVRLKEEN